MEKFAVDLDAVLDEFEFHEDQVRIGKKCHLILIILPTGREAERASTVLGHRFLFPILRSVSRSSCELLGSRSQQ